MSSNDLKTACGRSEDLVSYFYGESSEIEAKSFERHLSECAACRHEQAAFNSLRSSFESVRQQAANSFEPLTINYTESSISPAQAQRNRASGPSALAALREFFRLAPVWMRAGAVAVSVAFCALAGMTAFNSEINLAGTRIALRPAPSPEQAPPNTSLELAGSAGLYTQAEVDQMVAQREQDLRAAFAAQKQAGESAIIQARAPRKQTPLRDSVGARNSNGAMTAGAVTQSPRSAPPSNTSRPQPNVIDDEDEPRLSDLLSQVK